MAQFSPEKTHVLANPYTPPSLVFYATFGGDIIPQ
jgi:hypothetical protein